MTQNPYENNNKRIAFLSLHRDLIGNTSKNLDLKEHDELVKRAYTLVDALFTRWPSNGGDSTKPAAITKTEEEVPL